MLLLGFAASAQAGGPVSVCSGVPIKYPGAGTITLNYDLGNLGSRTNAQADALVTEAVSLWTAVPTATVTLSQGSDLPVDVTTSNYSTYENNLSDGLNPVVYDSDGSIIDMLYGVGAKSSTLGFAGSGYTIYPAYCSYVEGSAVINGYISKSDTELKITLAHEVGHMIGLDHTQLDSTQGLSSAYGASNYPLMYPIAYRDSLSLHEDDVASVSALYPESSLGAVYGELSGTFTQTGGTPILGANLWVSESASSQLFSIVSDYLQQSTGYFSLLLPAGTYTLHAEAVQADFTGGSSIGPYADTSSGASFQSPLYAGGVAMTPVTLGGASPTLITIFAGCAASVGFKLDGSGTVSGNCSTPCSYSLGSTSQTAAAAGLSGTVSVSSTSACAWTAASNASWITITSGASGSGNGTVVYSVSANTGSSSRTGTLTIAGETFSITQSGASTGTAAGGTSGSDTLTGSAADDSLFGLEGDDTLTPGAGNNLVYGGTGTDVLVVDSTATGDVTYLVIAQDTLIVYDGASTRHLVRGIETLRIGGADYYMPSANDNIEQDIAQIYVAAFSRAPALDGYNYWKAEKTLNGIYAVADTIFSLPGVKAIYPDSLSDADFVSTIFLNVFGRAVQAGGLAYWTGQLATMTRGQLVVDITNSALATSDGTDGKAYFNNRVDISKYAVTRQAASALSRSVSETTSVLGSVDANAASVVSAAEALGLW